MEKDNLYFQIEKGMIERKHFHPEVELIFILEGNALVKLFDKEYSLSKDDIILINSSSLHSIYCDFETIIGHVYYSYQTLADVLNNENFLFLCNSTEDVKHSYHELRELLGKLVYFHIFKNRKSNCMEKSLLYKLLDCLIEHYLLPNMMIDLKNTSDDERMQKIIHYINKNFQSGLSLSQLAKELYVSASTLSRLFRKQTGIYFGDYVNQMRIRYAIKDLLYTDKNITKIAVDCGFSNPSVFNKVFRENYNLTPSEYRGRKKEEANKKILEDEVLREKLWNELKQKEELTDIFPKYGKITIKTDADKSIPYEKKWNKVINIGSVYNLTLANLQYHTLYLTEQLGFTHVRLWNVFSKKLMINDGITIGAYNYDNINIIFDFLVSHHIIPFLDFGKRPDTAVRREGQSVFYEEEYIEFQSKKAWEAMLEDFVLHIIKRYGKNEVEQWIFEFSCDRIHAKESYCYLDNNYNYTDIFEYAYFMIKRLLPNAQVGGPMGIIHWDQQFLINFLKTCKIKGCVPDFLSFVLFPYITKEEKGGVVYKRSPETFFEIQEISMIKQVMKETKMESSRLYITEWNQSLSNRNYLNDSCFRAAYFTKKISEIWDAVDLLCIWMGSDWVSSYYDSVRIANGGSGMLTKDSIRKPVYYSFAFLNCLGEQLVEKGENYIITKNGKQNYHILCFYFKWYSSNYFLREEDGTEPSCMGDIFEDSKPLELEIIMKNMPSNGRYTIKKRTINQKNGSLLDEWEKFQFESELESRDVKYIREKCIPDLSMRRQTAKENVLSIKEKLEIHEISLIDVYMD